ncbi:putative ribonuclease H-like domain-containing protein [Tanacetum coccineum]
MITKPLHTLHMDLYGPTSVKSINHASYFLVINDDCTRFSWVFFLATKDETSGILQNFIRQIENQGEPQEEPVESQPPPNASVPSTSQPTTKPHPDQELDTKTELHGSSSDFIHTLLGIII